MNIYVGNLALEITDEDLRREFGAFGEVASVVIMDDRYIGSGQTRGYGFVEMVSRPAGVAAINALSGTILGNRVIKVIEALPLNKKADLPGKGTRFHRKPRQRE